MNLAVSQSAKDILDMKSSEYEELQSIKDKNFTIREIDIIACLIHNRGEKKIAALLSISPRTVSAHVRNIMQKLTCNSREAIIDFIEKSGKLNFLKNHYNILLINATFQNYLVKIGKLYNRNAFNIVAILLIRCCRILPLLIDFILINSFKSIEFN